MNLDSIEATALDAHRAGGEALLRHFRRIETIETKAEDYANLITIADRESEAAIIRTILAQFPEHGILAEESGKTDRIEGGAPTRWIIDPLDGTTNYAHGLPIYSISIAVEHEGAIVHGSVSIPPWDELFVARRGGGATRNGGPIHVSKNPTLQTCLMITGFPYDRRERADRYLGFWKGFMMRTHGVRRLGSAALDLCYVAAGVFDGYYEESLNPWDWAAGALLVREAGGVVTDYAGRPFEVHMKQCCASNGLIHGEMLGVLQTAAPFS